MTGQTSRTRNKHPSFNHQVLVMSGTSSEDDDDYAPIPDVEEFSDADSTTSEDGVSLWV